jgi:hypothetical protein
MGCCNNEKCASEATAKRRKIPWFSVLIAALVVLVALNWQ